MSADQKAAVKRLLAWHWLARKEAYPFEITSDTSSKTLKDRFHIAPDTQDSLLGSIEATRWPPRHWPPLGSSMVRTMPQLTSKLLYPHTEIDHEKTIHRCYDNS